MRPARNLINTGQRATLVLFLVASLLGQTFLRPAWAQGPQATSLTTENQTTADDIFKLERVPVEGGAELITIKGRLNGLSATKDNEWIPLVSVLRDTLGDLNSENDRLRYVWPLTYTHPSVKQRVLGAVPFLYMRVGNKKHFHGKAPPPVLDLAAADRVVWNKILWTALQSVLLDPYGTPIKATTRSYRQNVSDYRKSHIVRALSVLTLYQAVEGETAFSDSELAEIQARLRLTDTTFGGLLSNLSLRRFNDKEVTQIRDERGHNWELLRQRAEAESLHFEPLEMPDGSTTHVLLWVSKEDLKANAARRYEKRFLNISNPWSDKALQNWTGYSETRYFDSEQRQVAAEAPGARAQEMIPLALYGLDNPKIPMLLVDFRDTLNPKKREMSRRALQDVTNNVLSMSKFGNLPYFLGRTVFDLVTGRRGMDINQPSRLRTYAQLKLLLSLNQSLDPELRHEIGERLERVSLNPLENDLEVEAQLAREQYDALLVYAQRADGLPARIKRDRRAELVPLRHGKVDRILFRLANVLSFGKYTHREKETPEMEARLSDARQLKHHTRFLREVAKSTPQVEVVWNLNEVKRSLHYLLEHAKKADSKSAVAAAKIFLQTQDIETRRLCLESLAGMSIPKAKSELQRLYQLKELDPAGKDLISSFIKNSPPASGLAASESTPTRVDQ